MLKRSRIVIIRFLFSLLLCCVTFAVGVTAQVKLIIEGNVIGYELYEIAPTNNPGLMYPTLVRVIRVVEGREKSAYVIVSRFFLKKSYAEDNFGLNKTVVFELERRPFCDRKLKNLMYPGLTIVGDRSVRTDQTFTLVAGVDKNLLPLKKKLPCYFVSYKEE